MATSEEKLSRTPTQTECMTRKRLRVRIGPSYDHLVLADVNNESVPHYVDSPYFTGHVVVRVKDFKGIAPPKQPIKQANAYFENKKRMFAIQVSGRFKHEHVVDDILFGGDFDKKVSPPTGFWVAMKFATLIDPAIQSDLYCDKPWCFSPMLSAMNIVNCVKASVPLHGAAKMGEKNGKRQIEYQKNPKDFVSASANKITTEPQPEKELGAWVWKDTVNLTESNALLNPDPAKPSFPQDGISERRKFFQKQKNRQNVKFSPDNVYHFEIFAPFMDLNTFDLALGINVNLIRYMNDQPLRLVAKSQALDIPFFVIEFALVDSDGTTVTEKSFTSEELSALKSEEKKLQEQVTLAQKELENLSVQ
ncbi:hypothetical protein EDD86DRAFT_201189 [Gorgonomyces haynaldii]|nr:hypothetical protein EDD86DRAFT_201189 [Gorgonomyces haynaldii]